MVAYDPTTKKTSTQTVQHVFIDHDTDLLDVTLRSTPTRGPPAAQHSQHGQAAKQATHDETVHTTASHPWLSADRGWVRAGTLHLGEQALRADGTTAIAVVLRVVSGAASMWDLTVSHIHTFAVGDGQFVVHNCASGGGNPPSTDDLIDRGEEAAASAGRRGGVGVYAEGPGGDAVLDSSFTSSSVDQSGGHFQGIINDAIRNGSNVAGKCAEVGACAELYNHAGDLDGGYVDMGLWQHDGQPPCDTCQKILQQTANDLNITINIQDGIHELDPFEPEGW